MALRECRHQRNIGQCRLWCASVQRNLYDWACTKKSSQPLLVNCGTNISQITAILFLFVYKSTKPLTPNRASYALRLSGGYIVSRYMLHYLTFFKILQLTFLEYANTEFLFYSVIFSPRPASKAPLSHGRFLPRRFDHLAWMGDFCQPLTRRFWKLRVSVPASVHNMDRVSGKSIFKHQFSRSCFCPPL